MNYEGEAVRGGLCSDKTMIKAAIQPERMLPLSPAQG